MQGVDPASIGQDRPGDRSGQLAGLHTLPKRMRAMTVNAEFQKAAANAPQAMRDVAEKGAAQVKENLEKMTAAAGEATHLLKDTYSSTIKGAQDYSAKVLEFAHINTTSAFEYAKQLSTVKSPTEFFALSNTHLRQQFETLSKQAQELAAIAQKMTAATTESMKSGMHKIV
jgi:phasin